MIAPNLLHFLPFSLSLCVLAATPIKVAVVQFAGAESYAVNRDRILSGIAEAAQKGARVVVFPESALDGNGVEDAALTGKAMEQLRQAAQEKNLYIITGIERATPERGRSTNSVIVIAPDGREIFSYDKIYSKPATPLPGIFEIDGVPCSAMICADRWLRSVEEIPVQEGAKIAFEVSSNSAREWVEPFGWYWYVPRALRTNAWVVFANSGNPASSDEPRPKDTRHGHSAVVAPDGRLAVAARDDKATIVMAEIDPDAATLAETRARRAHPALRAFWEAGVKLQRGESLDVPALVPLKSAETDLTLVASRVTGEAPALVAVVRAAHARQADLVVFPARATSEGSLPALQQAARENQITVAVGVEHRAEGRTWNSAFVLGPDGSVLTRYDQFSAVAPYAPGGDFQAMWFRVKGVPAVVTLERDGLWTELAELASIAGARVHVHLDHDATDTAEARQRRIQVWSNLASYLTFAATANVVEAMLWDDLNSTRERSSAQLSKGSPPVDVYSAYSANLVVRTAAAEPFVLATRHIGRLLPNPPRTTAFKHEQTAAWLRFGAAMVQPHAVP